MAVEKTNISLHKRYKQLDFIMMKTTFIPQNILRVAAALLFTMIIAVGFTACTNEDNSVVTSS